jgi:ubiquinol-cytochrome c reductase cytochrome c1 subunit
MFVMMRPSRRALCLALLIGLSVATPALASGEQAEPHEPAGGWPHAGITGTFDRAALQRGYQVYKEVCSACHSMKLLAYRNLTDIGFNEEQVKAIASGYQVPAEPDDQGEIKPRNATPADRFNNPFANEKAARAANNGALPPDLSLMAKARHHGETYIYALLTGYAKPPEEVKLMAGMNYNPYYPGGQIAMIAPLADGAVTYADGTQATVAQMAKDVATFLTWAAEPSLEVRKQTGIKVILFLIVFAGLMYAVKRRVWSKLH